MTSMATATTTSIDLVGADGARDQTTDLPQSPHIPGRWTQSLYDDSPSLSQPIPSEILAAEGQQNAEALAAFWAAQYLCSEKLEQLQAVFVDRVQHPLLRYIQGVRNPFDPSVHDDISPMLLLF